VEREDDEPTFRLLFVCTGNICRSPYAQWRLKSLLAERKLQTVVVASAGTAALPGHVMSKPMLRRLAEGGVDASEFRSQALTHTSIEASDLILTATRDHRRAVSGLVPSSATRVFTLLQFRRLLRQAAVVQKVPTRPVTLQVLVARANDARGKAGASTSDDDIPDPWRKSRRTYKRACALIDEAVDEIANHLTDR